MTISLPGSTYHYCYQPRLSRRSGTAIALVLAIHLAIVWQATRPLLTAPEADHRVWTPLLLPREITPVYLHQPVPARVDKRHAPDASASKQGGVHKPEQNSTQDVAQDTGADKTAPTPASNASSGAASALPADDWLLPAAPAKPAASVDAGKALPPGLLAQALKSAGAIDRQLRAEHPQEFTAPVETSQSRLAKGMAEAHAAVKPGWLEPARIELFSAPNDPRRIYKVTTAAGEYCVYYADKGSMSENLSARSGHASFGEARVAPCPIRF